MNLIDRTVAYFNPRSGLERVRARKLTKALIEAAGEGRRNPWATDSGRQSQNATTKHKLSILRSRSRDLYENNPYHRVACDKIATLIVGQGITAVAKANNKRVKETAQELMNTWASSTDCDHDGRHTLGGLMKLAARTIPASGEVLLVRKIDLASDAAVPMSIRVLEPDHLDTSRDAGRGSNRTAGAVQGVQFDDSGNRIGYWLFDQHPGDTGSSGNKSRLVPASEVIHSYYTLRPGQTRGMPWGTAAYTRVRGVDDFRDARVEAQKIAALLVGLIRQDADADTSVNGDVLPDKLEPGLFARLNAGEDITFSNPPSVASHSDFVMPEEHIIAAAYGLSYQELTGDLKQANFASGKLGRMSMYQNVASWQTDMFVPQICRGIERWFLEVAALRGRLPTDRVWFDWRPPRKEILDLKNEIPAIVRELRSGLNSWSGALRDRGIDPKVMAEELKADAELWDELGLVLDIDPRQMSFNGQAQGAATDVMEIPDDEA